MIIRVFRAIVHDGKQQEFEQFFVEQAAPYVRKQPGLLSLSIGESSSSSPNEFLMVMYWKDLESIKAFAGRNWDQAVILEDERHLLKEVLVHHYDSLE